MAGLRSFKDEDRKVLMEFTGREGWGFSETELRATLEVDPAGFIVAEDDAGKAIGFIGCFNMVSDMAYVNLFIVRNDMRRKGVGKTLWTAMMERRGNKMLVLDSVSGLKEWYKRQGFIYETFSVKGFKGIFSHDVTASVDSSYKCVPLTNDLLPALLTYDQNIYKFSRDRVIQAWYCGSDKRSFVALNDKTVVGYASYHMKSEKECLLRALYADNDVIANELLARLLSDIPKGTTLRFVILDDKPLPKYFKNFNQSGTEFRLSTEEMPAIQKGKIIIHAAHSI